VAEILPAKAITLLEGPPSAAAMRTNRKGRTGRLGQPADAVE
jgi:hypothetical protein